MAIALYSTAGGIFYRWGRMFAEILDVNAMRGGAATARSLSGANLKTRATNMVADYATSVANPALLSRIYSNLNSKQSAIGQHLQSWYGGSGSYNPTPGNTDIPYPQNLLIQMAMDDNPVNPAYTTQSAMAELIRQIIVGATDSVNASVPAAGAQTAVGSPNGSGYIFLCSMKDSRGKLLEYALPETILAKCITDSQGTATKFEEVFQIQGQPALADPFSWLWPQGSGGSVTVTAVDPYLSTNGNLLYNSNPDLFTSHVPNGWTLAVGTGGSAGGVQDAVVDGGFAAYFGSHALQILGDGSTLTTLRQQFNSGLNTFPVYGYGNGLSDIRYSWGGGPSAQATQASQTSPQYALSFWIKADSVPGAGVLQISLVDNNFAVINDDAGTANTLSITLSGITTSYVNKVAYFRLPLILPSQVWLQIKATTAISNTKNIILGGMTLSRLTQMGPGLPYVGIASGNVPAYVPDAWTRATTNTFGVIQQNLDRCFNMRGLGLSMTSSGSPTIADSLVA
jgi:hypothetical protein